MLEEKLSVGGFGSKTNGQYVSVKKRKKEFILKVNVRVEYEPALIRHIAIQCPYCKKWFQGNDITESQLSYDYQLNFAEFHCPVCNNSFGYHAVKKTQYGRSLGQERDELLIEETDYPNVYEDCMTKKEEWH